MWNNEQRVELHPKQIINGRLNADAYAMWESMGLLDCFIARSESLLAGYAVFVTMPHPNFMDVLCAINYLYYVRSSWRSQGIGSALFNYAEQELILDRGIDCIFTGAKLTQPHATEMLAKLGYEAHETTFFKFMR